MKKQYGNEKSIRSFPPDTVFLIIQKTFVISDKHLGLNLFHGLQNNTYDNDKAGSTEGNACFENTVEDVRQNTDNGKTDRTDEDDVVKNLCQVITCRLAGSDTGNKSALLLHVVRYHQRIEGNGSIEVSKEDNQYDVY